MTAKLAQIHDELLAAIRSLEEVTAAPAPPAPETLASVRLKLSQASRARLLCVEQELYPRLLEAKGIDGPRLVRGLREKNAASRIRSTEHVGKWTTDAILQDWAGYRMASAAMRSAMRGQVEEERALLVRLATAK